MSQHPAVITILRYSQAAVNRLAEIRPALAKVHPERDKHVLVSGKTGRYVVFSLDENRLPIQADAPAVEQFTGSLEEDDPLLLSRICPHSAN